MLRELLIMRHGKSTHDVPTEDFERPLKDSGKRDAQRVGVWLHQQGLVPDLVVCSPAVRALETARKAAKAMGLNSDAIRQDQRIYAASMNELVNVIRDCPPDVQRLLLVGHNPGLADLLVYLAGQPVALPSGRNLLPTAALAQLNIPAGWRDLRRGRASLVRLLDPDQLPRGFPYPLTAPTETRERPAYYYTQSSVIPYRYANGELQVLIIASSKKKHWVVPKGIRDPGHSAQEAAAKEAWEEAGIEGDVEQEPLGSYQYEKWGAPCTVTVYPMAVDELISESIWEESHRGRKWVSPEEAAQLVKEPALTGMIQALQQRLAG